MPDTSPRGAGQLLLPNPVTRTKKVHVAEGGDLIWYVLTSSRERCTASSHYAGEFGVTMSIGEVNFQ